MPVAHILSHVAVSAYKVNDPTQIKYQDLVKRVIYEVITDADQGQAHLSPRWSQPALSLCHKVTIGGRREARPTSTGMEPPAPSAPSPNSIISNVTV